jgi:GGDEF domain-containing protein
MRRPPGEDLDALWGGLAAPDSVLAVFELVGFQPYHDSFGALAGAAMLERLYGRLAEAVRAWGRAYRLEPDRFAVLATVGERGPDAIVATADAALTEHGGAFRISPLHGMALVPSDADGSDAALRLADQRLYAARQRAGARGTRTRDALIAALEEARPALAQHMRAVGGLARQTGVELGLDPEALDELVRAAELHDVGKIAIPDEILDKSGRLSDGDWAFLRRHTVVGERILGAAAPLGPVAQLVRSKPRALGRQRLPRRPAGCRDPLGRPRDRGVRRLRHDGLRAPLLVGARGPGRPGRAAALGRAPVRPPGGRGLRGRPGTPCRRRAGRFLPWSA